MNRSALRLIEQDYRWSLALNRLCQRRLIHRVLQAVSKIGDGYIWHAVVLVLPLLFGPAGVRGATALAIMALSGVLVYKLVKRIVRRPRPCQQHADINLAALMLDEWSFPSGHTLHAVGFTLVLFEFVPVMGWVFLPFALLTALSRIVLGLHYPSDVLAGALTGALLAKLGIFTAALVWGG